MTSVALVGPDGAGKTTIARRAVVALGDSAAYIYMGVNLESSSLMLPSTRLILAWKRLRGRPPDLVGTSMARQTRPKRRPSAAATARGLARLANWIAEESFRQAVAWFHEARGRTVVFDRHFYLDYYEHDVAGYRRPGRSLASRLHGLFLHRLYPRPDAVVFLDVPAEVLLARKGQADLAWLEERRRHYLRIGRRFEHFFIVDAARPIDEVVGQVVGIVRGLAGGPESPEQRGAS
jgi:thymidylate kinase